MAAARNPKSRHRPVRAGRRLALVCLAGLLAARAPALVFIATNGVNYNVSAPAGALAGSGWEQTVPIGDYLGTVFFSNALLTAAHTGVGTGATFTYEGQTHTVTSRVPDASSDLAILRFSPPATSYARLHIEPDEVGRDFVVQGRGRERGETVVTGVLTNGWRWDLSEPFPRTRRWGVNRFEGTAGSVAYATFDEGGGQEECMLSEGDSGGPAFTATATGWKLAGVNYAVNPALFSTSATGQASFYATLYDYTGLYYPQGTQWVFAASTGYPKPCAFACTRVVPRIAWLTNVVAGLDFPADVGLAWTGGGILGEAAATGAVFQLMATNAGPYTVRNLSIDVAWDASASVQAVSVSTGDYSPLAGRWTLPLLADGSAATLDASLTVRHFFKVTGTNAATLAAADKPDPASANNRAMTTFTACPVPTLLLLR